MANAHTVYSALHDEHTPSHHKMSTRECVLILAHTLMQQGEPMQTYSAEHPTTSRHLGGMLDFGCGRRIRLDCKASVARCTISRGPRFVGLRKKTKEGKVACASEFDEFKKRVMLLYQLSGENVSKAKTERMYDTFMRCEECSVAAGKDIFLCNNVKNGTPVLCHVAYYQKYHTVAYDNNVH